MKALYEVIITLQSNKTKLQIINNSADILHNVIKHLINTCQTAYDSDDLSIDENDDKKEWKRKEQTFTLLDVLKTEYLPSIQLGINKTKASIQKTIEMISD